jgi:hypothetical protein
MVMTGAWKNLMPRSRCAFRSPSPPTAAFPAVEIAVVALAQYQVRPPPVLRGMLYHRAQGQSVWQSRIGAPNSLGP